MIDCLNAWGMDFIDAAIDRIHFLVDRSQELRKQGLSHEAIILMQQASELASAVREKTRTTAGVS